MFEKSFLRFEFSTKYEVQIAGIIFKTRYKKGCVFIVERLTWEQIQEQYPDQWVGLSEVQYMDNDGVSVESAVVKYADKTKSELTRLVLKGEIISRHTNPDGHLQFGMAGVL